MTSDPVPAASTERAPYTWRYVFAIFAVHKRALLLANLVAVIAALLSVPVPLLLPLLVDEVLLHKPGALVPALNRVLPANWEHALGQIVAVLVVTLCLRAASVTLQVWQTRQFCLVAKDLIFRIRSDLVGRLQRVSMAEYESLGSSTVASHLIVDLDTIDEFTGTTVSQLVIAVFTLFGAAGVLLWMHWQLGLFVLVMNPLAVYFTLVFSKKVKMLKRRENAALQVFQEALAETLDAIHEIRAANRERHYFGRIVALARDIRTHSAAHAWKTDAANRLSFMVFLFGIDTFRAVAMLMVVLSDLSIGEMIAVFGYLWYLLGPIEVILGLQYGYQGASAALERINRLLALHDEPQFPHLRDPFREQRTNSLELVDVDFSYGGGPPVLEQISLRVEAGETVAIVGASGAGKSTLVHIVLGLYPPAAGDLRFDGVSVRDIGMDVVRRHVGTVLQHPALLNATVRENISLGRPVADEQLWEVLDVAQLRAVVGGMPQGLDTVIGRDGVRLSGGQRQRLAVARMLLADPNVVILDEATSALDTETEARLHAALDEYLRGRTTVIIAHRLSAVRRASRVYVFDGGRIIEQGAHHDLLAQNGLYQRLYGRAQSS